MGSGLSSFIEDRFIVIGGRIVCDGEESVRVGLNPPGASVGLDVARSGDVGAGRVVGVDERSFKGAELDGVGGISGNGGENSFLGNSLGDNFNFHTADGVNSEIGGDGDGDICILDGDISGEVCIITRGDAANGDTAVTIDGSYCSCGRYIATGGRKGCGDKGDMNLRCYRMCWTKNSRNYWKRKIPVEYSQKEERWRRQECSHD